MYILFATNTVKNCLYLASKVKNEKSNTINRYGILPRIIMSTLIPIGQVMTGALGFFQRASPPYNDDDDDDDDDNNNNKISSDWGPSSWSSNNRLHQ
jgi:hypothetical protein